MTAMKIRNGEEIQAFCNSPRQLKQGDQQSGEQFLYIFLTRLLDCCCSRSL